MCHDAFFGFQSPKSNAPVILAGDSYSWAGGWIEGALTSGVNAACGVMKALNPEYLKPISPAVKQGIDPDQYVYGDVKS
jgi:tryptophan 2-monooxygenase